MLPVLLLVLFGVTDHDVIAPPPHQFVQSHVVEVTSIAEVNVFGLVIRHPQKLFAKFKGSEAG